MAAAFTHRIRVSWADCDVARIAYTGRIPGFALEAIDAWWEAATGDDWYRLHLDRDVGTPFVHMSLDFRAPVTPRLPLECEVRVLRVGESSARFGVRGLQGGELRFEGEFVETFVSATTFEKRPMPSDIRRVLLDARQADGTP